MMKFKKVASILCGVTAAAIALLCTACGGGTTSADKQGTTHDKDTLLVNGTTDQYLPHDFADGKCKYCDKTTIFTQVPMGDTNILKTASSKQGTVTEIHYETRAYYMEEAYPDAGEMDITKTAYVYLPYGYNAEDTTQKYNVLYLMHGNKLDEGYWFKQGSYANDDSPYTKGYGTENLLDYMMENGLAEKTIVVTPTFYSHVEGYEDVDTAGITQLYWKELLGDLMPYIAEHYNTYAADGSDAALKAARDHQAFAGLSRGASLTYSSIWGHCLEYISYIGTYSGGMIADNAIVGGDIQTIINGKNTTYQNCKINYWYVGVGTSEDSEGSVFSSYLAMLQGVNGLQEGSDLSAGDNCAFVYCNKTAHNYATWITCLYNCMQVFFKA